MLKRIEVGLPAALAWRMAWQRAGRGVAVAAVVGRRRDCGDVGGRVERQGIGGVSRLEMSAAVGRQVRSREGAADRAAGQDREALADGRREAAHQVDGERAAQSGGVAADGQHVELAAVGAANVDDQGAAQLLLVGAVDGQRAAEPADAAGIDGAAAVVHIRIDAARSRQRAALQIQSIGIECAVDDRAAARLRVSQGSRLIHVPTDGVAF